jgi:hypothetical protein
MKPICAAAIISVALVSSAGAQNVTTTSTTTCKDNFYTGHTCTTNGTTGNAPEPESPRQLSKAEERKYWEEKEASIRKSEAYCRPTRHIDKLGVTRLHYAQEGCDVGRTESDEAVAATDAARYGSKTTSAADTGTTRRTQ